MNQNWIPKITLTGQTVTLRPLSLDDEEELKIAAKDGQLWERYYTSVPESDQTANYIQQAIDGYEKGLCCAFAVINNTNKKVIGTTRFTNLDPVNARLEIGYTWYAQSFHGTKVNVECKLLLLSYAFEELNCLAVEFRTHHLNIPSQKAIVKLGAQLDGTLRNHQIDRSGQIRHTLVYSIIKEEWPKLKEVCRYPKN